MVTKLDSLQLVQKTAIAGRSIEIPEIARLILHASPKGPHGKSVFVHRANGRLPRIARFLLTRKNPSLKPTRGHREFLRQLGRGLRHICGRTKKLIDSSAFS